MPNISNNLEHIVGFSENWFNSNLTIFQRNNNTINKINGTFSPFLIANHKIEDSLDYRLRETIREIKHLQGEEFFDALLFFDTPKEMSASYKKLQESAPHLLDTKYDVITQYMFLTGQRMYSGMEYDDLQRLQIDVKHKQQSEPLEIIVRTYDGEITHFNNKKIRGNLKEFEGFVKEKDPDVIEVYEIEKTLAILYNEAKRAGVELNLGREKKHDFYIPRREGVKEFHPRRHMPRYEISGREAIDLWLALYSFNKIMNVFRSLRLPAVLPYFEISNNLPMVEQIALLSKIMLSNFHLAQVYPLRLQDIYRRGLANIIDHYMVGEYLNEGWSLPRKTHSQGFKGGLTELYYTGHAENVYKIDIRSMYPSIMISYNLAPEKDHLGKFMAILKATNESRFKKKQERDMFPKVSVQYKFLDFENTHLKTLAALQPAGYEGSEWYHFNAPHIAAQVTRTGRELIGMIRDHLMIYTNKGVVKLHELDTDGIYFSVNQAEQSSTIVQQIYKEIQSKLPKGMELELEGPWDFGYFKKIKNYALLKDNDIILKGGGLHGKNYELYIINFIEQGLKLSLKGDVNGLRNLYLATRKRIEDRDLELKDVVIEKICRFSAEYYKSRVALKEGKGRLSRQPHTELMLKSSADGPSAYVQGDIIRYYFTGDNAKGPKYKKADFAENFSRDKINARHYLSELEKKTKDIFSVCMSKKEFKYVFGVGETQLWLF